MFKERGCFNVKHVTKPVSVAESNDATLEWKVDKFW